MVIVFAQEYNAKLHSDSKQIGFFPPHPPPEQTIHAINKGIKLNLFV